jgi:hypothetical protein
MKLFFKNVFALIVFAFFLVLSTQHAQVLAQGAGEKGGKCIPDGGNYKCNQGLYCFNDICELETSERVKLKCPKNEISTAIGCVPIGDITQITQFFLRWAVGVAGGIALLLVGLASYQIMSSQGDPRRLQGGQELLLSAIGGLIMVILSIYLLRFVGVDLLGLFSG